MAQTKYPIHSQYERHIMAEQAILNNLKNKSTPLIVNDSFIPPINSERTDLPWTLGSVSHPWKNLYISNTLAGSSTPSRTEVLDVYTKLSTAASTSDLTTLESRISNTYATKEYVDASTVKIASIVSVGGFKVAPSIYVDKYIPNETVTYAFIPVNKTHTGFLKLVSEKSTNTPYWEEQPVLLDPTNPMSYYTGELFSIVKIGEKFPSIYLPEFDSFYTVVYNGTETVVNNGSTFQRHPVGSVYTTGENAKVDLYWGDLSGSIYNQTDLIDLVNSSVQTATAYFCGNWETWNDIPVIESEFSDLGYNVPGLNNYLVVNNDTSHGHDGSRWRYKYDQKVTTKVPYDKNHWIPEYPVNDKPFTAAEKAALGSGITSAKVATYDAYATNKVGFTDLASASAVGVVKVDNSTIKVDSTGTISVANPLGIQAVLSEDE